MGNGPQKGLAFHRDWSGTVVRLKRPRVLPRSRPAGLTADAGLRWCGYAAISRMEDLNVKICQEVIPCKIITCKIAVVSEGGEAHPTVC